MDGGGAGVRLLDGGCNAPADAEMLLPCRMQRRARLLYGLVVQCQQPAFEYLTSNAQIVKRIPLLTWFCQWEVAQGFYSEVCLRLAYVGSRISEDRRSGRWGVVLIYYVVWPIC